MYHVHKYASGGKTGPYFYCFFVDALANHVDGVGWGVLTFMQILSRNECVCGKDVT